MGWWRQEPYTLCRSGLSPSVLRIEIIGCRASACAHWEPFVALTRSRWNGGGNLGGQGSSPVSGNSGCCFWPSTHVSLGLPDFRIRSSHRYVTSFRWRHYQINHTNENLTKCCFACILYFILKHLQMGALLHLIFFPSPCSVFPSTRVTSEISSHVATGDGRLRWQLVGTVAQKQAWRHLEGKVGYLDLETKQGNILRGGIYYPTRHLDLEVTGIQMFWCFHKGCQGLMKFLMGQEPHVLIELGSIDTPMRWIREQTGINSATKWQQAIRNMKHEDCAFLQCFAQVSISVPFLL